MRFDVSSRQALLSFVKLNQKSTRGPEKGSVRAMLDQRRHQRIRFSTPPVVTIGHGGAVGSGEIENLSLSGLMMRTDLPLTIGQTAGCEFSVFGSPIIDVPATVVSRVGNLYGARFQTGPINQILIEDAIDSALASRGSTEASRMLCSSSSRTSSTAATRANASAAVSPFACSSR